MLVDFLTCPITKVMNESMVLFRDIAKNHSFLLSTKEQPATMQRTTLPYQLNFNIKLMVKLVKDAVPKHSGK